jgi:hypothetical protein
MAFQGLKLRLARTLKGLTLAELGEEVAASRQYVQSWKVILRHRQVRICFALSEVLRKT